MDKKPRTGGDGASHSRFPEGFRILQGRREYVTYPERSSVRIWYSDTPCHYESHFHSAVEIVMALRGEVVYNLLDGTYRLQAGEVLIVPSNCSHEMSMQEGSARQQNCDTGNKSSSHQPRFLTLKSLSASRFISFFCISRRLS